MKPTRLWTLWQAILLSFFLGFTRRGEQRFVQWATGLAPNVEEHTITQSLVGLDRPQDWKALEAFAEYSWHAVENKVHVHDLYATILHLMGLDHTKLAYRYGGRDYRLTDVHGNVVGGILA